MNEDVGQPINRSATAVGTTTAAAIDDLGQAIGRSRVAHQGYRGELVSRVRPSPSNIRTDQGSHARHSKDLNADRIRRVATFKAVGLTVGVKQTCPARPAVAPGFLEEGAVMHVATDSQQLHSTVDTGHISHYCSDAGLTAPEQSAGHSISEPDSHGATAMAAKGGKELLEDAGASPWEGSDQQSSVLSHRLDQGPPSLKPVHTQTQTPQDPWPGPASLATGLLVFEDRCVPVVCIWPAHVAPN